MNAILSKDFVQQLLISCLLAIFCVPALAQGGGWQDARGNRQGDTASRKTVDGFSGLLLLTPDEDWKQKWDTPPETAPSFSTVSEVPYGKRLFVLVFFANPKVGPGHEAEVRCDLRVIRPDGSFSLDQKDQICFKEPAAGPPGNVRLSYPSIQFVGDPGDPAGDWKVQVTLRDVNRDSEVALQTQFTLK